MYITVLLQHSKALGVSDGFEETILQLLLGGVLAE